MEIEPNSFSVVVDMQNDFLFPDGYLYVQGTPEENKIFGDNEKLINDIISFIEKFKKESNGNNYATTEDFHPLNSIEFNVFPCHCLAGTKGQEYPEQLKVLYENANKNILKGLNPNMFSYSISTGIEFEKHIDYLRINSIKNIYVMGVAYNFCVGESAIAYACQGFNTYLIRDLTRSVPDNKTIENMTKKLELYGVKITNFIH